VTTGRDLLGVIAALLPAAAADPGSATAMHDVTYISSGSPVVGEDSPKVTIRVHRGEHGLGDAKVFYATHTGSAAEDGDYLPKSGRLVLAAPSDDRGVDVQLVDDDLVEDVEDFEFRLERAEGGTVLRVPTRATVTIADDDGPSRISFAPGGFSNYENRGSVAVTVVRSGDATAEAGVSLSSADAGAVDGEDYTGVSETVTFASGDRVEVVPLPLLNDSAAEATEQVSLSLGSPVGAILSAPETATADIFDDDSNSADTKAPVTEFHRPRQGAVYRSKRFGSLHVITSDDASGVATLKGALRRRLRSGDCDWYTGKKFVDGQCGKRKWVELEVRSFVYWRLRGHLEPTTAATGVKNYTAYALSTDKAGNVERTLTKGRNKNTFRIK
jgi:Calx-beta domain-containing protein